MSSIMSLTNTFILLLSTSVSTRIHLGDLGAELLVLLVKLPVYVGRRECALPVVGRFLPQGVHILLTTIFQFGDAGLEVGESAVQVVASMDLRCTVVLHTS